MVLAYSARNTDLVDMLVPIDHVRPSAANPRKRFDQEALTELAESIREHGLLEPIVVRAIDGSLLDPGGPIYEIVAGERRWRACKLAGLTEISVRVHPSLNDEQALKLAIIENIQRVDLDPIEEAAGYKRLQELGMRQGEIAAAVNRQQPTIANRMRLLELPEDVQSRISTGELTPSHGVALCALKGMPEVASKLGQVAAADGWPSHAIETLVKDLTKLKGAPNLALACIIGDEKVLGSIGYGYLAHHDIHVRTERVLNHVRQQEKKGRTAERLRQEGKQVLPSMPEWNDQRYVRLWGDDKMAHDAGGLICEVWAVDDSGEPARFCNNPSALRAAKKLLEEKRPLSDWEKQERERKKQNSARTKVRDRVLFEWAQRFQGLTESDLLLFARRRIGYLTRYEDRCLGQVATWLGIGDDPGAERVSASMRIAAAKEELAKAGPMTVQLVWFLAEIASLPNCNPVPDWLRPWLESQGYVDPVEPRVVDEPPASAQPEPDPPAVTTTEQPAKNVCGLSATHAIRHAHGTAFSCEYHLESFRRLEGAENPQPLTLTESGKIRCGHVYGQRPVKTPSSQVPQQNPRTWWDSMTEVERNEVLRPYFPSGRVVSEWATLPTNQREQVKTIFNDREARDGE